MARHRKQRAKAWAARWKAPLLLGGAAGVLLLINAKRVSAAENPNMTFPGSGFDPIALPIQAGTRILPELPGSMAPTATSIGSAADYWSRMAPVQGYSSGYINFPSGSQAAAALFPVRADVYGSPYVQWAGNLYILVGPDASGNYTATQVRV